MTDAKLAERYQIAERLIAEQNFGLGVVAAVVAALAGALAWGVVTVITGGIPAWFAIAIGALVGYGMQVFGRGLTTKYSVVAAVMAIVGCVAGNLAAYVIFQSKASFRSIDEILSTLDLADLIDFYVRALGLLDLFFYFLAAVAAWYFAQRDLTQEEDFAMRAWAERPDPSQGYIQ